MQVTYVVCYSLLAMFLFFFFFNDTATTEIYTLSLHDALPISQRLGVRGNWLLLSLFLHDLLTAIYTGVANVDTSRDRKSTRLNSSHTVISYAVFCLKKKKKKKHSTKKDKVIELINRSRHMCLS